MLGSQLGGENEAEVGDIKSRYVKEERSNEILQLLK